MARTLKDKLAALDDHVPAHHAANFEYDSPFAARAEHAVIANMHVIAQLDVSVHLDVAAVEPHALSHLGELPLIHKRIIFPH